MGSRNRKNRRKKKPLFQNVISEYPLEQLYKRFKNHHRLKVFANKGTKCVCCHCEGTKLLKRRFIHKNGTFSDHIDLFTDKGVLMTVDHMLPKCKKGSEDLKNKQPMCTKCNGKKGGKYLPILGRYSWFYRFQYLFDRFFNNPQVKKEKRIIAKYKRLKRKVLRPFKKAMYCGIGFYVTIKNKFLFFS